MSESTKDRLARGKRLGRKWLNRLLLIQPLKLSPAWPLSDDEASFPAVHNQDQSPFFNVFSSELRILIYEAAFGDRHRFMHVIEIERLDKLGHFRCADQDSEAPTWQHLCYGETECDDGALAIRSQPGAKDGMVALLLSCRRIYFEALKVLYTSNTFHFRGTLGLSSFQKSLPVLQWEAIRHIHLSTMFRAPVAEWDRLFIFPPETLQRWHRACDLLRELQLDSLRFDIFFRHGYYFEGIQDIDDESLILALEPLTRLKAKYFEVESNIPLPSSVQERLRDAPFVVTIKERIYRDRIFSY